jgi:hypothetical protein
MTLQDALNAAKSSTRPDIAAEVIEGLKAADLKKKLGFADWAIDGIEGTNLVAETVRQQGRVFLRQCRVVPFRSTNGAISLI